MDTKPDLRTASWAQEFYVGRLVKLAGIEGIHLVKRDMHGRPYVRSWDMANTATLEGVVIAANPSFLLDGPLFDLFVEQGSPVVERQRSEQFKFEYWFSLLGESCVELLTAQYGDPCAISWFSMASDLLDHRRRLLHALNTLLRANREDAAKWGII